MIKENQLYYFGTSLTRAGHYFWKLDGDHMGSPDVDYYGFFKQLPFNPEDMPRGENYYKLGATEFYFENGFAICAICGSCYDKRPASKTVFFIKKELTREEMDNLLQSTPIAKKIINSLPFKITEY